MRPRAPNRDRGDWAREPTPRPGGNDARAQPVLELRRGCRRPLVGRPGALQHRAGRVRQAPARQARDAVGGLPRQRARGDLGRAAGREQPARQRPPAARRRGRRPRGDAVDAHARDRRGVPRHLQGRRDPALAVGALRGRRDPSPRYGRAGARARHERRERRARPGARAPRRARPRPRRRPDRRRRPVVRAGRHGGRRSGPALLHLGNHGSRKGDPARAQVPPRAQRVRAQPRRPGRRAVPRHGRVGLGRRHRASPRAVAVRGRPGRLRARGRLRRAQAARIPLEVPGHERLQHADRDPLDDVDRRRRQPLPAAVSHRLRRRRAAQPGGDPLVPSPVRGDGPRLLRPLRELPAVLELPVHGRARGFDGEADAGLGRRDPRRGRAGRCLPASAARSACVRAATRTTRSVTGTTRMRRARPSTASGSTRRTLRAWTTTATSGTRAAPTT